MIPVFLFDSAGHHGYSLDHFEARVLEICEEHQQGRRACAFALILHDAESPQFSKVLRDRDYWTSLNAISGTALTVFSVFSGALRRGECVDHEEHADRMRQLGHRSRRLVQSYFGLENLTFPALLFFQVSDGLVSGARLMALRAKTVEASYVELSELLRVAASAVRDSAGQLIRDPDHAFSHVEAALRQKGLVQVGKGLAKTANSVKDWLPLLFSW